MGLGAATCKGFPRPQAEPTGLRPAHVLGTVEATCRGPFGPGGDPVQQVPLRPSSQMKLPRFAEAADLPRSTQQLRVTPGFPCR